MVDIDVSTFEEYANRVIQLTKYKDFFKVGLYSRKEASTMINRIERHIIVGDEHMSTLFYESACKGNRMTLADRIQYSFYETHMYKRIPREYVITDIPENRVLYVISEHRHSCFTTT